MRTEAVTVLSVVFTLFAAPAAVAGQLPYRLGMTKAEVRAHAACAPYTDVKSTGGLECPNFLLDRKRNISFVFDAEGLAKVQLWFAESASREDAMRATDELLTYVKTTYGALESHSLPAGAEVTTEALFSVLDGPSNTDKVQLRPQRSPAEAFVFASIFRNPHYGYYVFLYHTRPQR